MLPPLLRILLGLAFFCSLTCSGQTHRPVTGRRVALVIGNNAYPASPLQNCDNDAAEVAMMLRQQLKFDFVTQAKDVRELDFNRLIDTFQKTAEGADVALFYYAGHGAEDFDGRENFLLPVDADLQEAGKDNAGLKSQGIPLARVLEALNHSTKGAKIILLDCCRERPAERSITSRNGGGLVMPREEDMPEDTLIMLAAAPKKAASDGGNGHGPFTDALLYHLPFPGKSLHQAFLDVQMQVRQATQDSQKPWLKLDGAGRFFFSHSLVPDQPAGTAPGNAASTATAAAAVSPPMPAPYVPRIQQAPPSPAPTLSQADRDKLIRSKAELAKLEAEIAQKHQRWQESENVIRRITNNRQTMVVRGSQAHQICITHAKICDQIIEEAPKLLARKAELQATIEAILSLPEAKEFREPEKAP
ncbi:MAG: caspase family protein [Prosthecobacter sp.]|nr:caspase family protein [Prosthecobacter sp.]